MRTLALLAALLLLAFQARAQTLQETADPVPAQDQPEDEDEDQPGDGDEDLAVSFTGEERLARAAAGLHRARKWVCHCRVECRLTIFPKSSERLSGTCKINGRRLKLCCK